MWNSRGFPSIGVTGHDAVFFDFDGVLANTEPLHFECWADVLKPYGIDLDWAFYRSQCIGMADREIVRLISCHHGHVVDPQVLWGEYPRKTKLFRARVVSAELIGPEWLCLLTQLRNRFKLAIVSSSARSEIKAAIREAGISQFFDLIVSGEDIERHKPAPDPYAFAAERLGVHNPLVVEDSEAGIASGRAAGFDVLPIATASTTVARVARTLGLDTESLDCFPGQKEAASVSQWY